MNAVGMEARLCSQQHPVCSGLCSRSCPDHGGVSGHCPQGEGVRGAVSEPAARSLGDRNSRRPGRVSCRVRGHGGVAEWFRQGPAKPRTAVRFRSPPPCNPTERVVGGAQFTSHPPDHSDRLMARQRGVSSAGERLLDKQEVTGSIPVRPTEASAGSCEGSSLVTEWSPDSRVPLAAKSALRSLPCAGGWDHRTQSCSYKTRAACEY